MAKNYNKCYNKPNTKSEVVEPEVVEAEVAEETVEPEVEEIVEETTEQVEAEVEEAAEETTMPKETAIYMINTKLCKKLNVRKKPDKDSDVLTILEPTDEFEIMEIEGEPEWVRVFIGDGVSITPGFCMKQFVVLKHIKH